MIPNIPWIPFKKVLEQGSLAPGDWITISHPIPGSARRVFLVEVRYHGNTRGEKEGTWVSSSQGWDWVDLRLNWGLHEHEKGPPLVMGAENPVPLPPQKIETKLTQLVYVDPQDERQ